MSVPVDTLRSPSTDCIASHRNTGPSLLLALSSPLASPAFPSTLPSARVISRLSERRRHVPGKREPCRAGCARTGGCRPVCPNRKAKDASRRPLPCDDRCGPHERPPADEALAAGVQQRALAQGPRRPKILPYGFLWASTAVSSPLGARSCRSWAESLDYSACTRSVPLIPGAMTGSPRRAILEELFGLAPGDVARLGIEIEPHFACDYGDSLALARGTAVVVAAGLADTRSASTISGVNITFTGAMNRLALFALRTLSDLLIGAQGHSMPTSDVSFSTARRC